MDCAILYVSVYKVDPYLSYQEIRFVDDVVGQNLAIREPQKRRWRIQDSAHSSAWQDPSLAQFDGPRVGSFQPKIFDQTFDSIFIDVLHSS